MTELAEGVLIGMLLEHTEKCILCEEPKEKPTLKSNAEANWEDDPDEAIGNNSGDLEDDMAAHGNPRPQNWIISIGDNPNHKVTPNPHHLIPGKESLKASNLMEWIFEGSKVKGDVGYDVNNHKNGVWLPSNNAMRGDPRWNDPKFKAHYVIQAMEQAAGHFHDRHGKPYSQFVTKILNKIAARLSGIEKLDKGCPYDTQKQADGRYDPPYFLYTRLNGVSQRIRPYLGASVPRQSFLYTSKLVKEYWKDKKTPQMTRDTAPRV